MGKSSLMCVLLGTLAWGQAAPSAPPPPQPAQAPVDTSAASVAPDAAVITVIGVCPAQPKPAVAKGTAATAAKPATAAMAPETNTPAADCKTVITKAQFEKLASALAPNVTPQVKKQLAGVLPRFIGMSSEAKKEGLDKTDQFKQTVEFAKMQILATELERKIQEEAANIAPEEIEKYYKEHADAFEQFNVDRLFVPRTKQPEAEAKEKEEDEKDEKLSDEAKKAKEAEEKEKVKAKADEAEQVMTKLAESLRVRAAAGEDFVKLQKEAFEAAGMTRIDSPTVNLPNVRRTGLPPTHATVFELKSGEVSQVISDSGGHYIYKLNSTNHVPLEQATNEIHSKLQNDRTREMLEKVHNSFKAETNDAYFGPGGVGAAPPPRLPRPRPMPQTVAPGQPQTPPPAQPPAAKPN
ncbi:MAG TPA: peptidyl-prolyl cis-trans isomerase [Candidatus Sulfotelmatobacter sp.]